MLPCQGCISSLLYQGCLGLSRQKTEGIPGASPRGGCGALISDCGGALDCHPPPEQLPVSLRVHTHFLMVVKGLDHHWTLSGSCLVGQVELLSVQDGTASLQCTSAVL